MELVARAVSDREPQLGRRDRKRLAPVVASRRLDLDVSHAPAFVPALDVVRRQLVLTRAPPHERGVPAATDDAATLLLERDLFAATAVQPPVALERRPVGRAA